MNFSEGYIDKANVLAFVYMQTILPMLNIR